jgi:hypothetical protein
MHFLFLSFIHFFLDKQTWRHPNSIHNSLIINDLRRRGGAAPVTRSLSTTYDGAAGPRP